MPSMDKDLVHENAIGASLRKVVLHAPLNPFGDDH